MRVLLTLLVTALLPMPLAAEHRHYVQGQVWSYKTRAGDEGSLLKIQKVERDVRGEPIYHISVIDFHLAAANIRPILPHEPVSQATLDASVVALRPDPGTFPSAEAGIAEWRQARGGVYTITVAETIDALDHVLLSQQR